MQCKRTRTDDRIKAYPLSRPATAALIVAALLPIFSISTYLNAEDTTPDNALATLAENLKTDLNALPPQEKREFFKGLRSQFSQAVELLESTQTDLSEALVEELGGLSAMIYEANDVHGNAVAATLEKAIEVYDYNKMMRREAVRQKYPVPPSIEPNRFAELSYAMQSDILCDIAEFSYTQLLTIPDKGLRDSAPLLEHIIAARKWLEQSEDVMAQMLALRLQWCVDSSILNELYRQERKRHGQKLSKPFNDGSIDQQLLTKLLKTNELSERESLDFALSFDTRVGEFCRDNRYSSADFLSGRIYEEAASSLMVTYELRVKNKGKTISEIHNGRLGSGGTVFPVQIASESQAANLLLTETVGSINWARDARFLTRLSFKYKGFAENVDLGVAEMTTRKRIEKEWSQLKYRRLVPCHS